MLLSDREKLLCDSDGCHEQAVFHCDWFEMRRLVREQHLCEAHSKEVLLSHDFTKPVGPGEVVALDGALSFDIELIIIAELYEEQALYLREVGGTRSFLMLIGIFEAAAIDRKLRGMQAPRPLTHDAAFNTISALGGVVEYVLVHEFENATYFARLCVRQGRERIFIDMRPSDAFVYALIANVPIFFTDGVVAKTESQQNSR